MSQRAVEKVREFYRVSFRPNDPELSVEKVLDFVDYCLMFYGKSDDAVYPYHFTFEEVCKGLIDRFQTKPGLDFDGDSVDREFVRDCVLANREEACV